jgi:serine/threonine protein kinase
MIIIYKLNQMTISMRLLTMIFVVLPFVVYSGEGEKERKQVNVECTRLDHFLTWQRGKVTDAVDREKLSNKEKKEFKEFLKFKENNFLNNGNPDIFIGKLALSENGDPEDVAVKRIPIDKNKFMSNEIRILSKLNNQKLKHVVEFKMCVQSGDYYYLITEVMDGSFPETSNGFDSTKPFPSEDPVIVLDAYSQIYKGLYEIHLNEILHGDVKGANIMYKKQKEGTYIIKFIDFGSSREFEDSNPIQGGQMNYMDIAQRCYFTSKIVRSEFSNRKDHWVNDVWGADLTLFMHQAGELNCENNSVISDVYQSEFYQICSAYKGVVKTIKNFNWSNLTKALNYGAENKTFKAIQEKMFIIRDPKKELQEISATDHSKEMAQLFDKLSKEVKDLILQKENEELEANKKKVAETIKEIHKEPVVDEKNRGCCCFDWFARVIGRRNNKIII